MGDVTGIKWTDHTFNPWIGCARVSPGCQHCYAEARDRRWGNDHWGKNAARQVTSDANWRRPLKWNHEAEQAGRRALVFCASLADVFEDRPDLHEPRARLFDLIDRTPHLIWQLLTKRPENVDRLIPFAWYHHQWPSNVWLGTTVEDQQRAVERIPVLLATSAPMRFLSCEPLLGELDLRPWLRRLNDAALESTEFEWDTSRRIGWVIAGGESGPGHRPLDLDHARSIRDECARWSVPFFFKQVGGHHATTGGDLLDGERIQMFPDAAVEIGGRS